VGSWSQGRRVGGLPSGWFSLGPVCCGKSVELPPFCFIWALGGCGRLEPLRLEASGVQREGIGRERQLSQLAGTTRKSWPDLLSC